MTSYAYPDKASTAINQEYMCAYTRNQVQTMMMGDWKY